MNTTQNLTSTDPIDRDAVRIRNEVNVIRDHEEAVRSELGGFVGRAKAVGRWFADFWREQDEAQERLAIMQRPWSWDQAHWVPGENGPVLHGSTTPVGRRRGPVTKGGWCACHLRRAEQAVDSALDAPRSAGHGTRLTFR